MLWQTQPFTFMKENTESRGIGKQGNRKWWSWNRISECVFCLALWKLCNPGKVVSILEVWDWYCQSVACGNIIKYACKRRQACAHACANTNRSVLTHAQTRGERHVLIPVQTWSDRHVLTPVQTLIDRRVLIPVQTLIDRRVQTRSDRHVLTPVQTRTDRRVFKPVQTRRDRHGTHACAYRRRRQACTHAFANTQ